MQNNHSIFRRQSRSFILSGLVFALCALVAGLASSQAHAGSCAVREAFCLAAAQKPVFPVGAIYEMLLADDPTCSDNIKNSAETDVDCGGGTCPACADLKNCLQASDCISNVCSSGHCAVPACYDGVKNGSETAVDCGGNNACPRCAVAQSCLQGSDCTSKVCSGGQCAAPTCYDGVTNGNETDTDCGGNNACPRCAVNQQCVMATDCQSGLCVGGFCAPSP